jgi:hypothetical protein
MNFKDIDITNDDAIKIGEDFKNYLLEKFKDNTDKLNDLWNIDPIYIIRNMGNPFNVNGYDPALVLLFTEFVKTQI